MARDTDDVICFESLGLSLRRARALSRWFDDEEPVGISSIFMAHLIRQREDRVRQWFLARAAELRQQIADLQAENAALAMWRDAAILPGVACPVPKGSLPSA